MGVSCFDGSFLQFLVDECFPSRYLSSYEVYGLMSGVVVRWIGSTYIPYYTPAGDGQGWEGYGLVNSFWSEW